ncbi:uncharacterized protein G2W53_006228 [Senna tora]|uniref:Uncharacterized protein n=1 Tax=Senna tora TaxID=362788 RepID=A0A835CC59_9FABA|nr:uncharacterized protein G2W53_006228 [Senna tora]
MADTSDMSRSDSQTPKSSKSDSELIRKRDPYYIHPSDNPGAQIVVNLLTLGNYLIWSRSIRIALKAKNKLGFIDGSLLPPVDTMSDEFLRWSDADSMVTAWILHSMTKDLMEAYMFSPSARDLWLELEEKFGVSDKSVVFSLGKQLNQIIQGNDSLALYSNKQKKLMDELNCLSPKSPCICNGCTCGGYKKLHDKVESNDTMTFLYGLNESYDSIVSTILLMEPMPSYNKVYSLVARIEKQRSLGMSNAVSSSIDASALAVKVPEPSKNGGDSGKRREYVKKSDRYCNFCNKSGHMEDACFKKHGYPEWFEKYKTKKSGQNTTLAVANGEGSSQSKGMDSSQIAQLIQMELKKLVSKKGGTEESPVNASYFADFAGNITLSSSTYIQGSDKWVIDSGASSHVTGNVHFLTDIRLVRGLNTVTLPDGSVKYVSSVGTVCLSDAFQLKNVLYVPDFRYNLISVSKLVCDSSIQVKFHSSGCVMQDLLNDRIIATGFLEKNLYILSRMLQCNSSLVSLHDVNTNVNNVSQLSDVHKPDLWHVRLGHPSTKTLEQLSFITKHVDSDYKGYKLFDLLTEELFVSRDVQFCEDIFPFQGKPLLPEVVVPTPHVFVEDEDFSFLPVSQNSSKSQSDMSPVSDSLVSSPSESEKSVSSTSVPIAQEVSTASQQPEVVVRASTRVKKPPDWMKNYVTCTIPHSSSHSPKAFPYVTPNCFSNNYLIFLTNMSQEVLFEVAMELVENGTVVNHPCSGPVQRIRDLMKRNWDVILVHAFREANRAADFMAKLSHKLTESLHCFDYPHERLSFILADDLSGHLMPRLCVS